MATSYPGRLADCQHERYSELSGRISWLRAGYLVLVAMEGYVIILDPAIQVHPRRRQRWGCASRRGAGATERGRSPHRSGLIASSCSGGLGPP